MATDSLCQSCISIGTSYNPFERESHQLRQWNHTLDSAIAGCELCHLIVQGVLVFVSDQAASKLGSFWLVTSPQNDGNALKRLAIRKLEGCQLDVEFFTLQGTLRNTSSSYE